MVLCILLQWMQIGGKQKYPAFKPGAKYGRGYCDGQCPHDMKVSSGRANVDGWKPQDNDENSGNGKLGTCCWEMDIWEGNLVSQAYTVHAGSKSGQYECTGTQCGDTDSGERFKGTCDKDGCDFASYRWGATDYYGPGKTVDTKQPMTVVTQFIGDPLTEIKRVYVQGGKVINNSKTSNLGSVYDSLTEAFCDDTKQVTGDTNDFKAKGGMSGFSKNLDTPQVLVMSLWDDHTANMLWLDSTYPTDSTKPGAARGTCAVTSGDPKDVESKQANSQVVYSDIKFGPINSTYKAN
uniref:cellulose 1,4-beta-cellobiosidase (non-reducing end) n=1 Tax=Reticulitermes flavipes gut symbiont cell-3 TaxID=332195 RepID=Q462G9_9EUKA|nr:exoglucanase-type cellulase [Reticulitermes flavipes gut symbiont cell-3]